MHTNYTNFVDLDEIVWILTHVKSLANQNRGYYLRVDILQGQYQKQSVLF